MAKKTQGVGQQLRDLLFVVLEAYMKATGKSLSTCSREFYGKSSFFAQLRKGPPKKGGQSIALDTFDAIWDKIDDTGIVRPMPAIHISLSRDI
jgi:hypothetical protein